jgi:pilus assembly protein CpaF
MNDTSILENTEKEVLKTLIEASVFQLPLYKNYSLVEKGEIAKMIYHRMCAYDVLQPFLEDCGVTEIMCNGPNAIFVERNGRLEKTTAVFHKESHYKALLQRIAADVNRKIDFSTPIVDARLIDGSRVNIVLDPVALNGPILTIRKFSSDLFSLDDLVEMGSMPKEASTFLKKAIKDRKNIFVSGGTGSGKTTLLNALCKEVSPDERIITIEDSAEISISSCENVVSLEKREANIEGNGEISISALIKTALRMRPDRIIVGEVRGAEAIDMLQAMNTGHSGSISTGHANSALDMLRRLETMVLSGMEVPLQAIRQQIISAIDLIVHLERSKDGKRGIASIEFLNKDSFESYQLLSYEEGDL